MGDEHVGVAVAERTADAPSAGDPESLGAPTPEAPSLDPLQPYEAPRASQDDDDDDDPFEGFVREPASTLEELKKQHHALSNSHKKKKGEVRKLREKLRVAELKAQQFDRLEETVRRNPRVKALFEGEAEESGRSADRLAARPTAPADFDESTVPFSAADSDVNRWIIDWRKDYHRYQTETQRRVETLERLLGDYQSRDSAYSAKQAEQSWVSVTEAAAGKIPHEGVRELFINAMKGFYDLNRANPTLKFNPAVIAQHHLKKLGVSVAAQKRAHTAIAQRMAEGNQQLPRAAAMAGGTPAPASGDRNRERLRDVHKRFLGRQ